MITLIIFSLSVGLFSAILIMLDVISELKEPREAISTKEVRLLYGVNVIIATLITLVLLQTDRIQPNISTWITVFLAYPLLMHTKFFTLKGETTEKNISVGVEGVYQKVSKLLRPGIEKSIEERGTRLLINFRGIPFDRIIANAKDYITPKAIKNKAEVQNWLDSMKSDVVQNPGHEDNNKRSIFVKILDIGGYRGIKYILKS